MSYSREKKLLAITYFELTDMPGKKDRPDIPISASLAAGNLGIDRSCLREWKKQKQRILRMKKGAKRWRGVSCGRTWVQTTLSVCGSTEDWKNHLFYVVFEECQGNISRLIPQSHLPGWGYRPIWIQSV
jgi:hypothetical protein